MVARLTPDQKAACSNQSRRGQNFFLVILNDNKHNKTAGFIFKNDPVILLI